MSLIYFTVSANKFCGLSRQKTEIYHNVGHISTQHLQLRRDFKCEAHLPKNKIFQLPAQNTKTSNKDTTGKIPKESVIAVCVMALRV
jgi:hypothetical protein